MAAHSSPIYRKTKGQGGFTIKPKKHMNEVLPQGHRSETKEQEGLHGGSPHVAGHPQWVPPKGDPIHPCHTPRSFGAKAQKCGFPKSNPKSTFTIHEDIFLRPLNPKLFLCAQNNSSTHQNNLNAFRNNFGTMFLQRKATKSVPAAPEHFRFLSRKIPRSFQNTSGILQEFPGVCQNQFDLMEYPETTFQFYRNYSDILSGTFPFHPKLFW